MKCPICESPLVTLATERYLYKESGLDNVWLENINVLACEECGSVSPMIPKLEEVHKAIAKQIILQVTPLRGQDLRFLRKQVRLKARQLADLMRVDHTTFSRWENDERSMGQQSDMLIRYICDERMAEKECETPAISVAETLAYSDTRDRAPGDIRIDVRTLGAAVEKVELVRPTLMSSCEPSILEPPRVRSVTNTGRLLLSCLIPKRSLDLELSAVS